MFQSLGMNSHAKRYIKIGGLFLLFAISICVFNDAGLWVSNHKRYMILFEKLFNTSESIALQMRWIQGAVALGIGSVCAKYLRKFFQHSP